MASGKNYPLSLVIKAVDKATGPIRKINARLDGISKAATRLGAVMTATASAPLAAIGATSARAFAKFEEGMSNVGSLIDTNVENLDAIGKSVVDLGRLVPVPLEQLVEGLTLARSSGVSAADQFGVLEGAAKLAVVGQGKVSEAVAIVTAVMNSFNLKGKDTARIYNTIFQATNVGTATIDELARGFGSVAGMVASAGIEFDEYMASVAALTTTGLKANEAHTQLRAIIAGLTRETKISKPLFDHLGAKSFKDLIAKSRGLVPALNRIKIAMRGNEAEMLKLLGSNEAFNAMLGLTGNQAQAFGEALKLMAAGGDTFEEKFTAKTKTAMATMQRLGNQFESIKISIGRTLVPLLERLVPFIEKATLAWEGLNPGVKEAVVVVGALVAVLGPVLAMVGLMLPVFAGVTAATLPLIAAIGLLGAAAYLIIRNWDDIALFFKLLWGDITYAFQNAMAWVKENLAWSPLGLILNNWEPIKAFFGTLWEGIVGVFEWAWSKIKPIVNGISSVFAATPLGWLAETLGSAGDSVFGAGPERARPRSMEEVLTEHSLRTQAEVTVNFENMPRGVRVTTEPGSTAPLDLSRGYSLVTP